MYIYPAISIDRSIGRSIYLSIYYAYDIPMAYIIMEITPFLDDLPLIEGFNNKHGDSMVIWLKLDLGRCGMAPWQRVAHPWRQVSCWRDDVQSFK